MGRAEGIAVAAAAYAYPCDSQTLRAALDSRDAGLVIPVLVGPERRIRDLAEAQGMDLAECRFVDVKQHRESLQRAVAMARAQEVEILVQGSESVPELLHAVLAPGGIRMAGWLSHVLYIDVPSYPRPLFITDVMLNIEPTLEQKTGIAQNAIDFAHLLGVPEPRVAVIAAQDSVTPTMRATVDAAALCKMAERGQITGAVVDGPLGFDNAVSLVAARQQGLKSAVAGQADILLVPDLESGNMLAKQLERLSDAISGGVVVGAQVPIVLAQKSDSPSSRLAACVLALLVANANRQSAAD
jgi:phosphate acetyltransferase